MMKTAHLPAQVTGVWSWTTLVTGGSSITAGGEHTREEVAVLKVILKVWTPDGGARARDAPGQVGVARRSPAGPLAPGLQWGPK